MTAISLSLARRIPIVAAAICIAALLAACGEGLSLVAVDAENTPLPFKTPRAAEASVGPESESTATGPEAESASQPAAEPEAEGVPATEDVAVVAEEPTATPEPEPDPIPTASEPVAETDADVPTAEDAGAWLLDVLENSAARNIALRAHEVSADLLVFNETADVTTYYENDLVAMAFASNVRSFYGVISLTALPPASDRQVESPLFFFEQVVIHESDEDAIEFLEAYQFAVLDLFVDQGAAILDAAMPGAFQAQGAPELTSIPPPGFADNEVLFMVEWPVNATATDLTPRMHIALLRKGNVTVAIALGSTNETQVYRFFGIVERIIARMN
jgi:hypothetical protein